MLSLGSVDPVIVKDVQIDYRLMRLTFDATPTDTLYLFAYCPALETGLLAPPVKRTDELLTLQLPAEWPVDSLHLYAFLRDRSGRTCDTIYIPVKER